MQNRDRLISTSRLVVRIASVTNILFLSLVGLALILSWVFPGFFAAILAQATNRGDPQAAMTGIRLLMMIGIVMAIATDRLLSALGKLVASARAGDPFVAENAVRLQTIGWCLLVLQLLDIPSALLTRFFPSLGSAAPNGDISLGGWVAVLMVFVLSRVFATGSMMRDELEATV